MQQKPLSYDVVIVGAGAAGISAAIKLKQLARANKKKITVCVLEKSSKIGGHILSGTIFDTQALTELLPTWKKLNSPVTLPVTKNLFVFLRENNCYQIPNYFIPSCLHNKGNYIISLSNLIRWLGQQAESLDVDLLPGFPAHEVLYNQNGSIAGVQTCPTGLKSNGQAGNQFQPGVKIYAKYTLFAEGARGELAKQLEKKFNLYSNSNAPVFSLGFKEIWEINPKKHQPGLIMHTIGWPLSRKDYGGSFLYHMENNQVSVGMVIGLNYKNPYFSPFEEFQRYKTHPAISQFLNGGKRIAYGARAINTGGLTSLSQIIMPGGALLGCSAGFLNAARLKGSHAAIKSGILAATATYHAITNNRMHDLLENYPKSFKKSWLHKELKQSRNFTHWMRQDLYLGALMTWMEQNICKGKFPWTLYRYIADHECTKKSQDCQEISYPKPDGQLTFDKTSSIYLSNIKHRKDQPRHLKLIDENIPIKINLKNYAGLESRYCPAGVYEFQKNKDKKDVLKIHAENCIHCKTCDIKDPSQNITWTSPEGQSGPNYTNM